MQVLSYIQKNADVGFTVLASRVYVWVDAFCSILKCYGTFCAAAVCLGLLHHKHNTFHPLHKAVDRHYIRGLLLMLLRRCYCINTQVR